MSHPYVLLKTSTDPTGHATVSVIDIYTGDVGNESAGLRAHREAERLNCEAQTGDMEIYIVRVVGEKYPSE